MTLFEIRTAPFRKMVANKIKQQLALKLEQRMLQLELQSFLHLFNTLRSKRLASQTVKFLLSKANSAPTYLHYIIKLRFLNAYDKIITLW